MTETTFEDVYSEVKKVNRRLDSMEKTLRALMTMLLPGRRSAKRSGGRSQR